MRDAARPGTDAGNDGLLHQRIDMKFMGCITKALNCGRPVIGTHAGLAFELCNELCVSGNCSTHSAEMWRVHAIIDNKSIDVWTQHRGQLLLAVHIQWHQR